MLSEIATMKLIKKHTNVPIPRVFDFETSADQPFGYPYMLLEYLGGRTLSDILARAVPQQHHAKVARQLAEVLAELQNLTFGRIGRIWCGEDAEQPVTIIDMAWHASPGPLQTSLEYYYNQRQHENREVAVAHPDDSDWRTACWVLRLALTQMIVEDRVRGPFPLCHLDLHHGNMLFDGEYNLTGIIDWSSAQAAPLEQLSVSPEFTVFPGLSEAENQPMIELKALVVSFLKDLESVQERRLPLDNMLEDSKSLSLSLTPLSTYLGSKSSEMVLKSYMSSPRSTLFSGKTMARLMYGETITWEQLREVYGAMPLF